MTELQRAKRAITRYKKRIEELVTLSSQRGVYLERIIFCYNNNNYKEIGNILNKYIEASDNKHSYT